MAKKLPKLELSGLTKTECALACSEEGCNITGAICGHPCKSGLQSDYQGNPEIVGRYREARKLVAVEAAAAKVDAS